MKANAASYLANLPDKRRERLEVLCKTFREAVPEAKLTMLYKMPTFELNGHWVTLGNQKQYIAIYFCANDLIKNVIKHHPELNTGVGCVRIRDTQEVPEKQLLVSFRKALRSA